MNFRSLFVAVILIAVSPSVFHAQTATVSVSMPNYKETVHNLGANGIAIVGRQNDDPHHVIRIDGNGKLMWEKDYTMPKKHGFAEVEVESANGNDIYLLTFGGLADKGGCKNPSVRHIDANTGESIEKSFEYANFGHVLSAFANDKYLFVMTTYYNLEEAKIETDARLKVYRFDKSTLEMTELQHEMNTPGNSPRVFWQMIRVENDFIEGYIMKDGTANSVTAVLARFDNEGKKISAKEVPLSLKSSNTRETNGDMPLSQGVARYVHKQNVLLFTMQGSGDAIMITPMDMCYLIYHRAAHTYLAYGFAGPGEQKKAGTKHTGFFAALLDSSFSLVKMQEHTNVSVISSNSSLQVQSAPDSRYISGYTCGKTDYLIECTNIGMKVQPKVQIQISGTDLSIIKSVSVDLPLFACYGNQIAGAGSLLVGSSEVKSKMGKYAALDYVATATRQYAIVHNIGKLEVVSEEIK